MTASIGPVETGKGRKMISLTAGTYCILPDGLESDLNLETIRRRWLIDKRRGMRISDPNLANTVRRSQLPKILLVAQANNAVDGSEERLQQGVPLFDETTSPSLMVVPIYRPIRAEHDTPFRVIVRATRDNLLTA